MPQTCLGTCPVLQMHAQVRILPISSPPTFSSLPLFPLLGEGEGLVRVKHCLPPYPYVSPTSPTHPSLLPSLIPSPPPSPPLPPHPHPTNLTPPLSSPHLPYPILTHILPLLKRNKYVCILSIAVTT